MLETAQGDFPSRGAGAANDTRQFTTLKLGMTDGIEAPTLFVHGTADTNAPFTGVRETASRLPRAETIWLEGGDHLISISRPEEIRPGLSAFLKDYAPRRGSEAPAGRNQ
jgi:pimeloyl-ACP methyl ester carboxylesterase